MFKNLFFKQLTIYFIFYLIKKLFRKFFLIKIDLFQIYQYKAKFSKVIKCNRLKNRKQFFCAIYLCDSPPTKKWTKQNYKSFIF